MRGKDTHAVGERKDASFHTVSENRKGDTPPADDARETVSFPRDTACPATRDPPVFSFSRAVFTWTRHEARMKSMCDLKEILQWTSRERTDQSATFHVLLMGRGSAVALRRFPLATQGIRQTPAVVTGRLGLCLSQCLWCVTTPVHLFSPTVEARRQTRVLVPTWGGGGSW